MKRIRFRTMNLQGKITWMLILLILIPLTLFGYLFNERSSRFVAERTDKESTQVLTLVKMNVDQMLREYEAQLKSIYDNEDVIAELSRIGQSPQDGNRMILTDLVNRFLRNFLRGKDDLDSIYLYGGHGDLYFADLKGSALFTEQYRMHPEWRQRVDLAAGKAVWLPTYTLPANRYYSAPLQTFIIGMQIKNVGDVMQSLGSLLMNVKITALDRLMENVHTSAHGTLLIGDSEGNVIWSRNTDAYSTKLANLSFYQEILRDQSSPTSQLNGESYRIRYSKSDYNNWYYISIIPQEDLKAQSKDLRQFLLVTLIAFCGSFLLLAWLISRNITKPIRQMALAMKKIHKDNLGLRLPAASGDEIGLLQSSFNSMRGRITDLIQEVLTISEKEKEAEVRALQAQINPHFVYNSLDTINWMAIDRDQYDISQMIAALSDIMRYAIRPNEPEVVLGEELKWARNYAYLQKMRFEDRFDIRFEVDNALLQVKVPRLFLQPYLENSILHGMENVEEGGLITVTILADDRTGGIRVVLSDNGAGLAPEALEDIRLRRIHGIGIHNLDDRLKLKFGPEYGVTIHSQPGEGMTVTIRLPSIE